MYIHMYENAHAHKINYPMGFLKINDHNYDQK